MSQEGITRRTAAAWQWLMRNIAQIVIGVITTYAVYLLRNTDRHELIPATLFTGFASVCSIQALTYSREKFRLDLFEKRLEYYNDMVTYCSRVLGLNMMDPEYRDKLEQSAYKVIRGNGIHKARLLFGEDIHVFARQLHEGYLVFLTGSHSRRFTSAEEERTALEEQSKHFTFATQAPNTLHERFGKYIYFGDYKRE